MTTTTGAATPTTDRVAMIDVEIVAEMCSCSTRHVRRMADGGKMPAPVRLGALVRWRRADIEAWIADGCPAVDRPARRRAGA